MHGKLGTRPIHVDARLTSNHENKVLEVNTNGFDFGLT
jgi:hypothetical protein